MVLSLIQLLPKLPIIHIDRGKLIKEEGIENKEHLKRMLFLKQTIFLLKL